MNNLYLDIMPNAYQNLEMPEGHYFRKGGVFLLSNPAVSKKLSERLHQKIVQNPENNEHCAIITIDLSKSFNDWSRGLSINVKKILDDYWNKLSPDNITIALEKLKLNFYRAKNFVRLNGMIFHFLQNFRSICEKEGGNFSEINMEAIIGIEPVNNSNISQYPSHCFGYFGGSREDEDITIYDTCIREAKEEGNIVFDETVLDESYQMNLRESMRFIPLNVDTQYKNTNKYTRVLVVLLGEDVEIVETEEGKILVRR